VLLLFPAQFSLGRLIRERDTHVPNLAPLRAGLSIIPVLSSRQRNQPIGCGLYQQPPFFFVAHPPAPALSPSSPPSHLLYCDFTMPSLDIEAELGVLTLLTQDSPILKEQQPKKIKRRDAELDPLILAAAFASGPHVTRHHHSHDLFPAVGDPRAEGAWDWTAWTGEDASCIKQDPKRRSYNSKQAPRRQRLRALGLPVDPEPQVEIVTSPTELKSPSLQTQTRSPRPSISNGAIPNERACSVYTIKWVLALNDLLLMIRARVTPFERRPGEVHGPHSHTHSSRACIPSPVSQQQRQ